MPETSFEQFLSDPEFFPDWTESPSSKGNHGPESTVLGISNEMDQIACGESVSQLLNTSDYLLFIYGTLTLPHVLQKILSLASIPVYQPASIRGYLIKMWGPYPALVPAEGYQSGVQVTDKPSVEGKAFRVSGLQLSRLVQYEGENYKLSAVTIYMDDAVHLGLTFLWSGYLEELEEGVFDATQFAESH